MHDDDLPADSRRRTVHGSAFYAGGLSVASYDLFVGSELSPLRGDVEFYLSCAGRYGGPVLELGTGSGRVVWPLAVAGHEVVGLDVSGAMLALAHGKAAAIRPGCAIGSCGGRATWPTSISLAA